MLVGYARGSSLGPSSDMQHAALSDAGCEKIFTERRSGSSLSDRYQLADALAFVRERDILVVSRLDRLARSTGDLHEVVAKLDARGVGLQCLEQSGLDMAAGTGKPLLAMLTAIVELETDIRKERQREGIAKAKVNGVYKGRKPSVNGDAVRSLHRQGFGPVEIARQLGIGRASVYRALD
jgi:DNA invertase Pin-like site-specific DNA recombinase